MAHGHPRYTGDSDFWVSTAQKNIANEDVRVNFINREDFICNIQATGRDKDFLDLKELGVQPLWTNPFQR